MSTSSDAATLVVLVRRDLNMSAGKSAAQVAHAAVGCSLKARKHAIAQFDRWRSAHGRIVVLAVDDLHVLEDHLDRPLRRPPERDRDPPARGGHGPRLPPGLDRVEGVHQEVQEGLPQLVRRSPR